MMDRLPWLSSVCACSFVLEFNPDQPTDNRPYALVGRETVSHYHLDARLADGVVTHLVERPAGSCPTHAGMVDAGAFNAVLAAHKAIGRPDDYRHVTGIDWRPDTCRCHLRYHFHRSEPGKQYPRTPVRLCDAHGDLPHPAHHLAVRVENQRRNLSIGALLQHVGDPHVDGTGDARRFRKAPAWEYDTARSSDTHARTLRLSHPGLDGPLRATLTPLLAGMFGDGAVALV